MWESKPALGTDGRVGSHLTSPIRRDARSWMTRPWKLTMATSNLTTARFWISEPWKLTNWKISKSLQIFKQYPAGVPSNKGAKIVKKKKKERKKTSRIRTALQRFRNLVFIFRKKKTNKNSNATLSGYI